MGPPLNRLLPIAGQLEKRLATLRIISLLGESSALVCLLLPHFDYGPGPHRPSPSRARNLPATTWCPDPFVAIHALTVQRSASRLRDRAARQAPFWLGRLP